MDDLELRAAIISRLTVPVWPHAGTALGLSRNASYEAAARGHLPVIRIGGALRVPTAALRKMLQMDIAHLELAASPAPNHDADARSRESATAERPRRAPLAADPRYPEV